MFDIIGIFAGAVATIVGGGVAAFNLVKNSQNIGGAEPDIDEADTDKEHSDEIGAESNEADRDDLDTDCDTVNSDTGIILVHSEKKNIVHHLECRYANKIKNPVSIVLGTDNMNDWKGCSYCDSDQTLEAYIGENSE
jgi:hypothetical protein